jgi:hypothetical protein
MINLLADTCPICNRFVPQDKLMVFDQETKAPFHYCCYQIYKERKRQAPIQTEGEINDRRISI